MKSLIYKAENIVHNSKIFYKKSKIIKNIKFDFYNYNISYYKEFRDLDAYFLRGFCVINDRIISPSLHKFFNVNENDDSIIEENDLINGNYNFYEKYDGSLIIPFILDDGLLRFRTKGDYSDFYENMAKSCITEEQEKFIRESLNNNIYPLYEIVSPFNKIVVKYNETKLVLLGWYDLNDKNDIEKSIVNFHLNKENVVDKSQILNKYKELETIDNFEGYVIQEHNGYKLFKLKAIKYIEEHRNKDSLSSSFYILKHLFNETIDDMISKISNNEELLSYVNKTIETIIKKMNSDKEEIERILNKDSDLDRKSFAVKYKDHDLFHLIIKLYLNKEQDNIIKFMKEMYGKTDLYIKKYLSRIENIKDFKFKIKFN